MAKAIITYRGGIESEVDITFVGEAPQAATWDETVANTLGTKRLPQVGEVWRSRANVLVAVISQASVLDGGYNAVTLSKGDIAVGPGRTIILDLDGNTYGGSKGEPRPLDLVTFVTRFDIKSA